MTGRPARRPPPLDAPRLAAVSPNAPGAPAAGGGEHAPPRGSGPSDEALMFGLVNRDVAALETLYDRYSTLVYSVALRVVSDRGLAEDIVQEVFLQLWRRPNSYDSAHGRFIAWIASVARNRSIDEVRRRSRRTRLEHAGEDGPERIASEDRTTDPQREAELGEQRAAVRAAMDALPPEQRRVLQLAYFGGLTQAEIARHTGSPLGTVKTRVRLGMQKLRLLLSDTWRDREGGYDRGRPGRGRS